MGVVVTLKVGEDQVTHAITNTQHKAFLRCSDNLLLICQSEVTKDCIFVERFSSILLRGDC